jgi:guanosine-3',5'-bis(diphosphate) 3'-pyrophosphohydrolase
LVEALRENFEVLHYEDHIRRPLPGGNQSLLMKLKGENTTLSLTIQTELMRKAARFGWYSVKMHRKPAVQPFRRLCRI